MKYIEQELSGVVSGLEYPEGGLGRIAAVPVVSTSGLLLLGLGGLFAAQRRRA